ncbi:homoserine kinase [Bacillus sp. T33-2]|uniref:homoserine kinase n=1 Tax=Bacillus sp. T33-2 TaxID=2054168 RepID=UPI000C7652B3|nr:homoserine kinase [Bacillus sp. T33-2]PLR92625.1 homoserine kinase [Bacillus sp. T33-2]
MTVRSLRVKVPASSANLGPGFDSVGLALKLYLTVEAETSSSWEVHALAKELQKFPQDERHFICQIAIRTAAIYKKEMPPLRLVVDSEIPLARGLGSSAAAIVAGVELADHFCQLGLDKNEKLSISSRIEGHPDNVGAALFGGLIVGCEINGDVEITAFNHLELEAAVVIPASELLTETSREVLPRLLEFQRAVQGSAVANQFLAAVLSGNWALAGRMMSHDLFHQPYRRSLVPYIDSIEKQAVAFGAFGTALSGAGPSIICLAEVGKGEYLAASLQKNFPDTQVLNLAIDRKGSHVSSGAILKDSQDVMYKENQEA